MASVRSVGVQKPSTLPFLVSEGILPADPPNDSYKWRVFSLDRLGKELVEDELVITEHCVVWSSGGVLQQVFRFDAAQETITDAAFTNFKSQTQGLPVPHSDHLADKDAVQAPLSGELKVKKTRPGRLDGRSQQVIAIPQRTTSEDGRAADKRSSLCRALVIVLQTQAHVYMIGQTSHVIHLPFEVEAVFPTFLGVLLQKKHSKAFEPLPTPIIPPPPHNTFSYSQISTQSTYGLKDSLNSFSTVTPSSAPHSLALPSLEQLQATITASQGPELPSLLTIMDPLRPLGAVGADKAAASKRRPPSEINAPSGYTGLDADDRLLYVSPGDEIKQYNRFAARKTPLSVALTVNSKHGTTSLWTITFAASSIETGYPHKRSKSNSFRRRSSFTSHLSTGATTPVARSYRYTSREAASEAPGSDRQPELLNSVFERANGPTKSSRRVSSLLARADLSTDQGRGTFSDFVIPGHGPRKSRRGPSSEVGHSHVGPDQHATEFHTSSRPLHNVRTSLDAVSLQGLPLEDIGSGLSGVFEQENVGHARSHSRMNKLKQEMSLQKIYSLNGNSQPQTTPGASPGSDISCFTLEQPQCGLSNLNAGAFLICIMYHSLGELLIFQVNVSHRKSRKARGQDEVIPNAGDFELRVTGTRRSGVLDACKVSQGSYAWILVLNAKGSALTLQAPWSSLVKIDLPDPLSLYNPNNIASQTSSSDKAEGGPRRILSQGLKGTLSLERANCEGGVSIIDSQGQRHRIQIQLKPSNSFVHQMIKVCHAVLPLSETYAEPILRGWWDVMLWLEARKEIDEDQEFTALTVVIFALGVPFTNDRKADTPPRQKKRKGGLLRSSSGANTDLDSWDELVRQESGLSLGMPEWADQQGAWDWTMSETSNDGPSIHEARRSNAKEPTSKVPLPKKAMHVIRCIELAREFVKSSSGQSAIGNTGYLPIAASRDSATRRTALASILVALHLYREELKLNTTSSLQLHALTPVLAQLGTWLGWSNWSSYYTSYYMLEDQRMESCSFENSSITGTTVVAEPFPPPSILQHLQRATATSPSSKFPTLLDIVGAPPKDDEYTCQMIQIVLMDLTPRSVQITSLLREQAQHPGHVQVSRMALAGLRLSFIETLPESVAVPFRAALSASQMQPSGDWTPQILSLIDRADIAFLDDTERVTAQTNGKPCHTHPINVNHDVHHTCNQAMEVESVGPYDGSAEIDRQSITRLMFKEDQRFAEAAKLVHPVRYPVVKCVAEPGWSESDLLEAQQELAKIVGFRTLSVALGRSLLFYSARLPMLTEKYPVHGYSLKCIMKPSDSTVTADSTQFTEDKAHWAFFHAGVQSGLSISRNATGIDTSWMLFNKPKELTNRHAGFLLALGLNGHLKLVAKWVAFKYLTPKHNMTSIGLLLGLSASYIGTMDTLITRLLSVHVARMLPLGAADLNLSSLTQTSGIFGIGLLYCNTQHRRMSELMLYEMESMDVEDSANPMDSLRDEGYRLATGFALGFINLGRGKDLKGLQDMHITERLLTLAIATKVVDQVRMADSSTAGATMAIALIFMKTEDEALARKIDVPETAHQFDYVRPDHFLLRTFTRHLIMWNSISADHNWITAQIPSIYRSKSIAKIRTLSSEDLSFFNILAGLCLSIGLRYAGTGNTGVRDLLITFLDQFMRLCRIPASNYDAKLARVTVRNCQDVLSLSASSVMAGTGDLLILRRLRSLHNRLDPETPYGSHLATHFAIGILFLGGGTHTFSTSNLAIASLLCAFYPLFPAHILDNKSHLQAFRHFWVLAAEPRCLVPRDIDTQRSLSLPITIVHKDGRSSAHTAPCLLPEIDTISRIETADPSFWPIALDFANNPKHVAAFRKHQSIFLRKRSAYDTTSSVFSATMKALHDQQVAHQVSKQPFEWVLNLPAFRGLDRAERALVLPGDEAGKVGKGVRGTVVDDRLMLETGTLGSGKSERLWNLRLLLRWAEESQQRGEGVGWLRQDVIEGLRARLALWRKEGR